MTEKPKGTANRWQRSIVLDVEDGKLRHSGQTKALRIRRTRDGIFVGCTFVTNAAVRHICQAAIRAEVRRIGARKKRPKRPVNNCGMCSNPGCKGGCYDY